MKKNLHYLTIVLSFLLIFSSCNKDKGNENIEGANTEVLKNWAENIIIPAYKNYQKEVNLFVLDAEKFKSNRNKTNFDNLKKSWLNAYKAFQKVLIFDFGISEKMLFNRLTNTFPTSPKSINKNIELLKTGKININKILLSKYQGFPALDYLLFEKNHTLSYYQTAEGKYASEYIFMLTQVLQRDINKVVKDWDKTKETYINDTDKSVVGSYSNTINAFIRVFEKDIRATKVGYAAGAIKAQNNKPAPEIIEAYYNAKVSKELLKTALKSSQDFFNGKHFLNNNSGESLKTILIQMKNKKLADKINLQYQKMYQTIEETPLSLKETAISDNAQMRKLYNVIQKNVAYYKTEMLATLSVQVAYQDADGD